MRSTPKQRPTDSQSELLFLRAPNHERTLQIQPTAESPRGISPRGAHRSGREPLDSSGSCHRMKGCRLSAKTSRFLPFPVDLSIPAPVTRPLPSTDITPLQQYYGAVRPWLAHRYFRPHASGACAFSLGITNQVLKFRAKARMRFTPPLHRTPHGP